jgi:hypothetical protein
MENDLTPQPSPFQWREFSLLERERLGIKPPVAATAHARSPRLSIRDAKLLAVAIGTAAATEAFCAPTTLNFYQRAVATKPKVPGIADAPGVTKHLGPQ